MARQIVFLVHGMGSFEDKWSGQVTANLKAAYGSYDVARLLPFDDQFEIVEIVYNDLFDQLRGQWKSNSGVVLEALKDGGLQQGAVTDLTKIAQSTASDEFASTHILDVFLYRFVGTVREAIRVKVARAIVAKLDPLVGSSQVLWSVIAHSLGTSVTHDALHALYTSNLGGPNLSGVTRAQVLTMVANTSRLLESDIDAYESVVHPSSRSDRGVCRYFLNVKHDWDPVPRPKEFRPVEDWPDLQTRIDRRFDSIPISAFQNKDIHSLEHYLANPRVHIPLFRRLLGFDGLIPKEEAEKAIGTFEAATPFGAFKELQQQLKHVQLGDQATWKQVLKSLHDFRKIVSAF